LKDEAPRVFGELLRVIKFWVTTLALTPRSAGHAAVMVFVLAMAGVLGGVERAARRARPKVLACPRSDC
jgi:hypothetical protein